MKFHCDALTTRWASPMFAALTNFVRFERVPHDYVYELAVLLATPGLRDVDLRNWFERKLQLRTIQFVKRLHLDVHALAVDNAASVSEADAWQMLALTPKRSTPSTWGRALILDYGVAEVANRVGVKVEVVSRWKHATGDTIARKLGQDR